MTAGGIAAYIGCYAIAGTLPGVFTYMAVENSRRIPDEAKLSIGFMAGLFWPLTVAIGVGAALYCVGRALGCSFAALWEAAVGVAIDDWRERRAARRAVPRAQARRRL